MEKKTIGTFIAALRKASGMTQRELAEKCNVSDKAISRWERDECAPDLTLLPVLAEIFDITVDELLRGERKTADAPDTDYQREKTEKQMRNLLRKKELSLRDRSWISRGIAIGGLLAAIICNALHEALIGFFVALAFFMCAAICEVCFLNHAISGLDDFSEEQLSKYRGDVVQLGKNSFLLIFLLFAATLPLATIDRFYGMDMATWLFFMAPLFALAAWILFLIAWRFFLAKKLSAIGYPVYVKPWSAAGKKLLRRLALYVGIFGVIAAVLLSSAVWVANHDLRFAEKTYFDTVDDFVVYMEDDSGNIENREDAIVLPPNVENPAFINSSEVGFIVEADVWGDEQTEDKEAYIYLNGEMVIFEWKNTNVYTYGVYDGRMYVITQDALFDAYDTVEKINLCILGVMTADIAIGSILCLGAVAVYFKGKKEMEQK